MLKDGKTEEEIKNIEESKRCIFYSCGKNNNIGRKYEDIEDLIKKGEEEIFCPYFAQMGRI